MAEVIILQKLCSVADCLRQPKGRGLCSLHWKRWRRHGDPNVSKHAPRGAGSVTKRGYRRIRKDGKLVYEHRLVMERHLGRKLRADEHVHHKDEIKLNNVVDNFEVLNSAEHSRAHATFRNATHKECSVCRVTQPRSEFYKELNPKWDPNHSRCKTCCRTMAREYQARKRRAA